VKLDQLFSHWDHIHQDTLDVCDMFSEAELDHRAYKGGWSVRQIVLHIASAEDGWFRFIATNEYKDWPPSPALKDYPTLESIKNLLKVNHEKTKGYLGSKSIDDLETVFESEWGKFSLRFVIWHVIEHEVHHRGELSLILGTLGREGLDV
jgi:uncharacterized damage-inducible protein DinB